MSCASADIKEMLDKVQMLNVRCSDLVDRVKRENIRVKSTKQFSLQLHVSVGKNASNSEFSATAVLTNHGQL